MIFSCFRSLVFLDGNKCLSGKNNRIYCHGRFSSITVLLLLFCSAFYGFCDHFTMVSVPIGFEINGLDRSKDWLSENGVFLFGFLEKYGDDFDGYVVGIRYNIGNITANVPVWTVGGGVKVPINSTIRLNMGGGLVLIDNTSGNVVWSSNSSNLGVQKASLLNNGNLVLLDHKDEVMWESFDSPTNALLPGQSVHYPQNLRASSAKSTLSYYSLVIPQSGDLALVWQHNVTYWRSRFSSSRILKEARFGTNGLFELYDLDGKVVWSVSSRDFGDPSVTLRHLRLDQDGNLRMYSWDSVIRVWKSVWQAVEEECNVFGACGLYSVCGYNSCTPVCKCLYSPSLEWEISASTMSSSGLACQNMADLGNCRTRSSMFGMRQTVLYGLYPPNDVNLFLSEKDCKDYCSNDTSCFAITSMNDGSGICTIKRTSFISGYKTPSIPSTSYLKVCSVPQAVAAQSADPHDTAEIISSSVSRHHSAVGGNDTRLIGTIAFVVIVTVLTVLVIEISLFMVMYRRRRKLEAQTRIPFRKDAYYSALIRLNFEEIKELTDNFENQLGLSVFKGTFPSKTTVVIKVLKDVIVLEKEFRVVVSMLSGIHHRNVISIKGFCFEHKHKFLIYEYVSNGSLDEWLLKNDKDSKQKLWQHRLHIAVGIANAIAYLHTECQKCIIHGNLKLGNVLFDENFVPKVTDFGLQSLYSKETTTTSSCSTESPSERDIYMLGEILLQIVTCKREVVLGKKLQKVLDLLYQEKKFLDSDDVKATERVARIAMWCMQAQPYLRPSIGEVVKVLEGTLSVDRPPSGFLHSHDNVSATEIGVEDE